MNIILCLVLLTFFFLFSLTLVTLSIKKKKFLKIICLVGSLVSISLEIYYLYKFPDEYTVLRETITTIIAAIYGGLITLVGVAWTIDWSREEENSKRKDEIRPFFYATPYFKGPDNNNSNLHNIIIGNSNKENNVLSFGQIQNSSKIEFEIKKVKIGSDFLNCSYDPIVARNELFSIVIYCKDKTSEKDENEIKLIIADIDGNLIQYSVNIVNNNVSDVKFENYL
jgi:hypothetical protein